MTLEAQKETLGFQTEIKELMHLMVHSLYSNKEIFLRELISNASDACDKLRFAALSDSSLYEDKGDLQLVLEFDKEANTVSISDNGIGMSRQDAVDHLGTIARSGTGQFLKSLTGDEKQDAQLIGQFGVGFYSAFIVAKEVEVLSRKAGQPASEGIHWSSTGDGEFSVRNIEKAERGTTVILHLKDEEKEFAEGFRLRSLVKKYSDHIAFPVMMEKESHAGLADEEEDQKEDKEKEAQEKAEKAPEFEAVNEATALWTLSRSEIKDEEYQEFYKHVAHDFENPLAWSHNRVEGKLDYTSLLYIPARAPFDLWNRDAVRGLKLYVQRVFIMDEAEQFLPLYLRFVKGIVDSNDLSLNVSREILQKDRAVDSMRSALTKRVLDMLAKMAKNEPEKYATLWKEFGMVLKEGPAEDYANREKIAKLMRFSSTRSEGAKEDQCLEDYVARMKEGQDKIYYITGDSYSAAAHSPHLEIFRKKEIEVLILHERIDEWLMSHLTEFDGKQFQDVVKGDLDLGKIAGEEEDAKESEADNKAVESLIKRMEPILKDQVESIRVSHRLTDSPACLVLGAHEMGHQMRKIMEAAGQAMPETKPTLEINADHPLVKRLDEEQSEDRFKDLALTVFDQAALAEGKQIQDPAEYVGRVNRLLLELLG